MKVLIDTLGAPALSGGMRLYAEEVITSWSEAFPGDELTVVGGAWARSAFPTLANVRVVSWPNDSAPLRMFGQFVVAGLVYRATRSDALVSVSAIVSPLASKSRRVCVVHDWRHMRNEHEFGFLQRLYRRLWVICLNAAGATISISAKTDSETKRFAPLARRFVVENGRDHARRWAPVVKAAGDPGTSNVVTFGHHLNKRPDLVIRAMAEITTEVRPMLTVLGARGDTKVALEQLAHQLGVEQYCAFPGFVETDEYNRLIQSATVVVLASTDEGFGLPVAEAQYFGIPVVTASDSGLEEIHSDLFVSQPEPREMAAVIVEAIHSRTDKVQRADQWSWAQTASEIRRIVGVIRAR